MDELKSAAIDFSKRSTNGNLIAEYIWLGGNNGDIRSKCMTLPEDIEDECLPIWNYDGSSTNQAKGEDSEVLIAPRRIYPDPFRQGKHIMVLCDTWYPDGSRTASNFRQMSAKVLEECYDEDPWFGIEQSYIFYRKSIDWPLGFPVAGYPKPQGQYYCGVGSDVNVGRQIMDAHYRACLHAGIKIAGMNAEVMPGQWEFQIGPCQGIDIGDHLWMARYLLLRCAEMFGAAIKWDPKPLESNDWNGSGGLLNFSTNSTREEGGYQTILEYMKKLEATHHDYVKMTGINNDKRLNGKNESSDWKSFSYGVGDRLASVRIPKFTEINQKGYIEDRRPASNMDPYVICAALADITILNGKYFKEIKEAYDSFVGSSKQESNENINGHINEDSNGHSNGHGNGHSN